MKTKIQSKRIERGLTLRELAERSRLSIATVCAIENGKTNPTPLTLGKLAKALELPSDYFLKK